MIYQFKFQNTAGPTLYLAFIAFEIIFVDGQQINRNLMILLLALTLLLQLCQACPSNCDSCGQSNLCSTCASGYTLSGDRSSCDLNGLSETVIIIISCNVVIFLMFFAACCCYRRYCRNKPSQKPSNNEAGITQSNLNRFPQVNDKNWQNIKSNDQSFHEESCTICLSRQVNVKTQCGHGFHNGCIKKWFQTKASCPTCRSKIGRVLLICNICYLKCRIVELIEIKDDCEQITSCKRCIERFS